MAHKKGKGMTGKHHSKATKEKMRKSTLGHHYPNLSRAKRGKPTWNKGLTKKTDKRIRKYANEKIGNTNGFKKGHSPWHKGKNKNNNDMLAKLAKNRSGNKSWLWEGGKSFEPYGLEFNKELKELIRKRDKYRCRICGRKQLNRRHPIHHIDYNKTNNDPKNLITLCHSHHSKTNHNRKRWKKLLSSLHV